MREGRELESTTIRADARLLMAHSLLKQFSIMFCIGDEGCDSKKALELGSKHRATALSPNDLQ
jgi:hypothetical protein